MCFRSKVRTGFDERGEMTHIQPSMQPGRFLSAFGNVLVCGLAGRAQQPIQQPIQQQVTLNVCIQMALVRNLDIQIQRFGPDIAEFNLGGLYGAYDPVLSAGIARVFNSQPSGVNTEGQLLRYAKQAIAEARRIRPDLFITNLSATFSALTAPSTFPVPEEYEAVVVDFVAARAEFRDDEFVSDSRAAALMQRFKQHMLGIA